MSYGSHNPWSVNRGEAAQTVGKDLGLRRYMLSVYNYMGLALGLTGLVAYLAASSGLYLEIARTPMIYVIIFAPLALVFFLSAGINRMSLGAAQLTFWAYAALMGLSLGFVFLVYTRTSIASTFFVTAATFLGMSLYGYTTKRDLTGMGSFMMMGLFGIIIASIVNIFLASSGLQFLITIVGVIVFTGLTAWDTQRIRDQYYTTAYDATAAGKSAIMGALQLYLDFVNLFLMLLRLFGDRRS